MKQEHRLFLLWPLILSAMISVTNATDASQTPQSSYQSISPFDNDPFFQSDDVFNQIRIMQQAMDRLMQQPFQQINKTPMGYMNAKNSLNPSSDIQMEERNNELIYTIKQHEGSNSKINVSVKDGIFIVNTSLIQKTSDRGNGSQSYRYSQSNYNQSFILPKAYDPNSIDIKSKGSNLIVTFKKKLVSDSLKI